MCLVHMQQNLDMFLRYGSDQRLCNESLYVALIGTESRQNQELGCKGVQRNTRIEAVVGRKEPREVSS
jgi:hypothetical protein